MTYFCAITISLISGIIGGVIFVPPLRKKWVNFLKRLKEILSSKHYWLSTKKVKDGEIAPFIFLSIEIFRERNYYNKPLSGSEKTEFDKKLSSFQSWVENIIPFYKKEYKWYWTGHRGLYGFYNNNPEYNIAEKVVDLGKKLLNSLSEFSQKNCPIDIRITVHSSQNDIQFRKDIHKRTGVALDFLFDISIPSDEVNLYITQNVYDEIKNDKKLEFIPCRFEVLRTKLFSHKKSTIAYYEKMMSDHLDKGEIIHAADFSYQIADLDKSKIYHFTDILIKLESYDNRKFPIKVIRFLYKSMHDKISENNSLKENQSRILTEYKRIEKAIEYCLMHLHNGWYFEYVIMTGKSPNNFNIQSALQNKVLGNEDISIHNECCLCTAKYGITNLFINRNEKAIEILDWIKKQKIYEYRSQASIVRDWRYTSRVLRFAILMNDKNFCHELFIILMNAKNWRENSEWNSIRGRGLIIADICDYFERYSINFEELESKHQQKLKSEVVTLINEITSYESCPIVLDGVIGLVGILKIELNKKLKIENLDELVEKHMDYMMNTSIWNDEIGAWGYENIRTFYRVRLWYKYWDYKLNQTR